MSYYLGFDGGGTKTESALIDAAGAVLARGIGGPSNPLRVGFDHAFAALGGATTHALSAARLQAQQIRGVCAGLAGAGQARVVKRVMAFLVETFPTAFVHVTTDLEVALEAAVGSGPGVVLIAGTGSAAYGRNASGQKARAGGHGPWIGDEGSAFDIGRRAVAAVARTRDGLAPVTLLTEMIPAALDCASWEALAERIAENPDEVFPRIFPVVAEAADAADGPAREILFTAALGLSMLAGSVIRKLELAEEEFVLAKAGGVFGRSQLLDSALDSLIASAVRRAKIAPLRVSPAEGAAQLAKRLSDLTNRKAVHGPKA